MSVTEAEELLFNVSQKWSRPSDFLCPTSQYPLHTPCGKMLWKTELFTHCVHIISMNSWYAYFSNDWSVCLSSAELFCSISWRYRPWGIYAIPVFISIHTCKSYHWCHIFLQLARYLNRTYWEKKQEEARKSPTPSAPAPVPMAEPLPAISQPVENQVPVQPVSIVEVCWTVQKADVWVCVVDVLDPE